MRLIVFLSILLAVLIYPTPILAANFTLSPEAVTIKSEESFDLNLSVDSGTVKLDALEIDLSFDPEKLELIRFQPTNVFNAEIRNVINNSNGSLLWTTTDIQKPRKVISGDIDLGTLTFKAKQSGQSTISFASAQAGSIDTPIESSKNSVSVNTAGSQNIFEKIINFFARIFKQR